MISSPNTRSEVPDTPPKAQSGKLRFSVTWTCSDPGEVVDHCELLGESHLMQQCFEVRILTDGVEIRLHFKPAHQIGVERPQRGILKAAMQYRS
jgi:hypothetical protein